MAGIKQSPEAKYGTRMKELKTLVSGCSIQPQGKSPFASLG